MIRCCVVIPVYNHPHKLKELLTAIEPHELDVLMVDDGSDKQAAAAIAATADQFSFVQLKVLETNTGKGGAVMAGLRWAAQLDYSHAIQVDADYQHNMSDLPEFQQLSSHHPEAVICGIPEYDETVNKGRYYARYLTHVWVWINTLSLDIKDSMCGFRSYPVQSTIGLIDRVNVGQRMNFDTEILVRLHWQGTQVINLTTRVVYHEDVPSNFRIFKDNVGISWMHTRLFFGMLLRLPVLLYRKFTT